MRLSQGEIGFQCRRPWGYVDWYMLARSANNFRLLAASSFFKIQQSLGCPFEGSLTCSHDISTGHCLEHLSTHSHALFFFAICFKASYPSKITPFGVTNKIIYATIFLMCATCAIHLVHHNRREYTRFSQRSFLSSGI